MYKPEIKAKFLEELKESAVREIMNYIEGKITEFFNYYFEYFFDEDKAGESGFLRCEFIIAAPVEDFEKLRLYKNYAVWVDKETGRELRVIKFWLSFDKNDKRYDLYTLEFEKENYLMERHDSYNKRLESLAWESPRKAATALDTLFDLIIDEIKHGKARKMLRERFEQFKQTDIYAAYIVHSKL